jgi:hypothetical protein
VTWSKSLSASFRACTHKQTFGKVVSLQKNITQLCHITHWRNWNGNIFRQNVHYT